MTRKILANVDIVNQTTSSDYILLTRGNQVFRYLFSSVGGGGTGDLSNYYTKPQTDSLLASKADSSSLSSYVTNSALTTTLGSYSLLTDARFTDSRTPTGTAGGELTGTYPNPSLAATIAGNKTFSGNVSISGTGGITGSTTLGSTLGVTGATTLSSTLGVAGITSLTANQTASSTTTGTLRVTGGLGVSAAIWGATLNTTGAASIGSTLGVTGATTLSSTLTASGVTTLTNATPSTSANTGALIVTGGVGVGGSLYTTGIIGSSSNIVSAGVISSSSVSDATTADGSTGALRTVGGLSVGQSVKIGTTLNVTGNTTLSGTLAVTGTSTLTGAVSSGALTSSGIVTGTQLRVSALNTAPSSLTDTGTTGEVRVTNDGIWIAKATNTWQAIGKDLTPGTYTNATVTVDSTGRISNVVAGSGSNSLQAAAGAGRYYLFHPNAGVTSNTTSLNVIRFGPMIIEKNITIDQIAAYCTALGTSALVRLGLYTSANGMPDTLLFDSGDIDSSTTGMKSATYNTTLTPGLYYSAHLLSVQASYSGFAATTSTTLGGIVGYSTLATAPGYIHGYTIGSYTYAALPTSASAAVPLNTNYPSLFLRVTG